MTTCTFDPKTLAGLPIGMTHCPGCGCLVLAAMEHPACDDDCPEQDDADREVWAKAMRDYDTDDDARATGEQG